MEVLDAPQTVHKKSDDVAQAAVTPRFVKLSGAEFSAALSGRWTGQEVIPRWLESPKLKYYCPPHLSAKPEGFTYFLAVVPDEAGDEDGPPLMRAVGMLELEVSPWDQGEVWLKFISVHPAWQRQGIAKGLLEMMVAHLQAHPRLLSRSRSSEEGRVKIQAYISSLLDAHALPWKQTS